MTDENLEEFSESAADPEAEKGFDEDETGTDEDLKDEEAEGATDKEGESEAEEEEGAKDDDPEGGKDKPGEKTAAERAEERAAKFKDEPEEPEDQDEPGDEEEGPGKSGPSSLTKEQVKDLLSLVEDDALPGEIVVGNEIVDLKALRDSYPEDFNSIKVLSGVIAQKIVDGALEKGEFVKASDVEKQMQGVSNALATFAFWDAVRDVHPDGKKVVKSDEFKAWIKGQSKSIQGLYTSPDADDAISLLDFYKEDQAKKTVKNHDDELRAKKKKKDGLHSDGVRTKPSPQKSSGENDKDDIQAGFEEEVEEFERKKK